MQLGRWDVDYCDVCFCDSEEWPCECDCGSDCPCNPGWQGAEAAAAEKVLRADLQRPCPGPEDTGHRKCLSCGVVLPNRADRFRCIRCRGTMCRLCWGESGLCRYCWSPTPDSDRSCAPGSPGPLPATQAAGADTPGEELQPPREMAGQLPQSVAHRPRQEKQAIDARVADYVLQNALHAATLRRRPVLQHEWDEVRREAETHTRWWLDRHGS